MSSVARSDGCGLCPCVGVVRVVTLDCRSASSLGAQVPGRYPYLAALFADGTAPPDAPSCAGVAVGPAKVLTSAACLSGAILTDIALNRCGAVADVD